ncbi:unnamed protein product [Caenorhabditis bovis]|uniref:Translation initiation factor eIF-2B subunit epsilon n=1 Tax=Caenorhabditis bovis TaxID=2654633 RepID=A0A8S1FFB7_9PELO|nr:unnamed protein product [Caenorhabditis bovis]
MVTASDFKKPAKKDEVPLTGVIILDLFDQRFAPIVKQTPCFGFTELCNIPVINYTFSWLMRTEIRHIMLVVSGKNEKYARIVENEWSSVFNDFSVIVCDGAISVGDFLREIHNRELITSDFLLISNPATVTSSTLEKQIFVFRKRRQENPDNVMTLLYGNCECREKTVVGIESATKKLLLYPPANATTQLRVDKVDFYNSVEIRRDITDSGIALCSRMIATQFSDNFDFQSIDDVIREILSKDDILGLNIHVDIFSPEEAAYSAKDYFSFIHLNSLLLERWFYPIVPEKLDVSKFISVCPRNVYIEDDDISNSRLSTKIVEPIFGECLTWETMSGGIVNVYHQFEHWG